jgi:hypothetical protein
MDEFPVGPYMAVVEPTLVGVGLQIVDVVTGELTPLEQIEFSVERISAEQLAFTALAPTGETWSASMNTSGVLSSMGSGWEALLGNERTPLDEFLEETPLTVFYADGGSSIGRVLFQPRETYPPITEDAITSWTFEGTDITAEHVGARNGMGTVKEWVLDHIESDFQFIVDDDRAGEIADLVLVREHERQVLVRLLHLKASSRRTPGARVEDFYELLGQAARSVVWCQSTRWLDRINSRLQSGSRLLRGTQEDLDGLLARLTAEPRPIRWEIGIVQPGLVASRVNEVPNIATMLNDLIEWTTQHDVAPRMYFHA